MWLNRAHSLTITKNVNQKLWDSKGSSESEEVDMYCFSRLLTPEGRELGERNQDALYCIKRWMWECGDIVKKKHISHVLIIWKSSSRIFPKWEGLRSDFIRKERRAYVRRGTQFLNLSITVMCFISFLCNLHVQWCALRPSVQSFFRL